ncbi:hypothetical protein [Hubei Wuhan insect virus 9]|uniref:hypothetical protein n=1 Tax=Hubei Wuhan insect virus 9 TaxID=1922833 RepID=UPI000909AB01|nr:hypothetical protein [Hubei Wuhan insect virus 9]APG77666.1 hypothetical protein [Hubei Wuhan insect virus 9]
MYRSYILIAKIFILINLSCSVPINQYQYDTTLNHVYDIFDETFENQISDNLIAPLNFFTMFVAPVFHPKCMYATIENILTESNYHMPADCGMPLTVTVHDSTFSKSIVDIGTQACSQYNRKKCNPPLHRYKFVEDFKGKMILSNNIQYDKYGGSVKFYLDTSILNEIIVLKDEMTDELYWITKYCSKFMTVTSDYRLYVLGPGIHYYDAANKQFCITDYSNMCKPVGPFKHVTPFYRSLPIYVTIYTSMPINHTFAVNKDLTYSMPYDDHNSILVDSSLRFTTVTGSIRKPQPTYQCVTYHTVPLSSVFHLDAIIEVIETKFILYYHSIQNYFTDLMSYFYSWVLTKFLKIFRISSFLFFDIIILFFYLIIYNNNYYTVGLVIAIHATFKYILYM